MKKSITHHNDHSFAALEVPKSDVAVAYMAVDIHYSHSAQNQALYRVYPDMLLSGTKSHSRAEFLDAINMLGASIDIAVTEGILVITLRARAKNFNKLLLLAKKMLTEPLFSNEELTRVKKISVNELHDEKEDSKLIALHALRNKLFQRQDRRYTYSINETIDEIQKLKTKSLSDLHKKVLASNWTCSIAGSKKTIDEFNRNITILRKTYPMKESAINKVPALKVSRPSVLLHAVPSKQNIDFSIGTSIQLSIHDKDYMPLQFGLAVLGWPGFAGRLMSTVREKEGYTYGIYARTEGFYREETGYFRILTFFAPDKAVAALHSTYREISKIFEKGISSSELKKFKVMYLTKETLKNDSITTSLNELHLYASNKLSMEDFELHKERLHGLTCKEVNQVLKKYLNPKTLTISGAGPTTAVQKDIKDFFASVS